MLSRIFTYVKNLFVTKPNDFEVIYIEGYVDVSYKHGVKSVEYSAFNKKNGKFYHRFIYNHKTLTVDELTRILNTCGPIGREFKK